MQHHATLTALCMWGVLQVRDGEKGASINGVLFPAPSDMSEFDKRENGYQRVEVPRPRELPPASPTIEREDLCLCALRLTVVEKKASISPQATRCQARHRPMVSSCLRPPRATATIITFPI